jgi:hypothetical protein
MVRCRWSRKCRVGCLRTVVAKMERATRCYGDRCQSGPSGNLSGVVVKMEVRVPENLTSKVLRFVVRKATKMIRFPPLQPWPLVTGHWPFAVLRLTLLVAILGSWSIKIAMTEGQFPHPRSHDCCGRHVSDLQMVRPVSLQNSFPLRRLRCLPSRSHRLHL